MYNVIFVDVISALNRVALNKSEKRSLFGQLTSPIIYLEQINVIFMQPLYEAVILCGCIINRIIRDYYHSLCLYKMNAFLNTQCL